MRRRTGSSSTPRRSRSTSSVSWRVGSRLGRQDGGRVVLAERALPGERVVVELSVVKATLARGVATEVLRASPDRVVPPCPEALAGCGGCDLQHASTELQRQLKAEVVRDALARIGRLPDVRVDPGEHLSTSDHRTVLRCAVRDGRAGFRRRRSTEVHVLDRCLVAHPLVEQIVTEGRFPGADEIIVRVGARTGDRMVVVSPTVGGAVVPPGVVLVGADELATGAEVWVHELVARRRFRISAGSFFQARPDGAEAAVRAVGRALAPFDPAADRLVDLYGGVGLFTAGLGARRSVVVERSHSSVARRQGQPGRTRCRGGPGGREPLVTDPSRCRRGGSGARWARLRRRRCCRRDGCHECRSGQLRPRGAGPRRPAARGPGVPDPRRGARRHVPAHPPHRGGDGAASRVRRVSRTARLAAALAAAVVVAVLLGAVAVALLAGGDEPAARTPGPPAPTTAVAADCAPVEPEQLEVEVVRACLTTRPPTPRACWCPTTVCSNRPDATGDSTVREVDIDTGQVIDSSPLAPEEFGEGLAMTDDGQLVQLTWLSGVAHRWDADTLEPRGEFRYDGEGWGLSTLQDGTLVMTDGSDVLTLRDPEDFSVVDARTVATCGRGADQLNELEWDGDSLWANRYQTDELAAHRPRVRDRHRCGRLSALRDDATGSRPATAHRSTSPTASPTCRHRPLPASPASGGRRCTRCGSPELRRPQRATVLPRSPGGAAHATTCVGCHARPPHAVVAAEQQMVRPDRWCTRRNHAGR